MRILIASEDVPYAAMGGLAKHALNLARALVKEGHTVDFLGGNQHPIEVAGQEGQFGGRFTGALSGHLAGWKERRLGFYNPIKRSWLGRRFARIIAEKSKGYDVVHYHGHVPNLAKYLPAGVPFIQTRHDQGSDCLTHTRFKNGEICTSVDPVDCASCITKNPNSIQRTVSAIAVRRYRKEVVEGFHKHSTVFVSEMLRRNFCRSMGSKDWGLVLPHFVDSKLLEQARNSPMRLPDAMPIEVIVVGKLYEPKGIDKLVSIFSTTSLPRCRLLVVGEGPQLSGLQKLFSSSTVRFMGWCDPLQTLQLTAGADIVVVPSLWEEPFGGTTLEGLLLDKPTFALARGATPELVRFSGYPDQLHLFTNLQELVDQLMTFDLPSHPGSARSVGLGNSNQVAMQLMPIYRAATCR